MTTLLLFAVTLLAAVLVSEYASRSVLSTAVLFLVVGFVAGGLFDVVPLEGGDESVRFIAEIALFTVLFTDGMRVGARELRSAWRLPGRALLFGLPLTLVATAAFAHWFADLDWPTAFLIGAALSPTDPVFASAIVGRLEVPARLRRLLNVESGINDGLALPVVLILLELVGAEEVSIARLLIDLALGVAVGVGIPWLATVLERSARFAAHEIYEPLFATSVGLLVFAVTSLTHANEFLAAFAAGVTIATVHPKAREEFHRFGEIVAELLKLGALLLFGILITPTFFTDLDASDYVFVALALFVARPVGLGLALVGSGMDWREKAAASWFGPKGFASVVYALIILDAVGGEAGVHLFHLMAIVVAASMVAHSSTDVAIAKWFRGIKAEEEGEGEVPPGERPATGLQDLDR